MFENYIELSTDKIVRLFDNDDFPLRLNDVLTNPSVGEAYKSYISAEVNWWIYEDLLRDIDTRDDEESETIRTIDELNNQYKSVAKYDLVDFRKMISSAVKLRINFLCRPCFTLKQFVFRGQPGKTMNEIVKRLKYFSDYTYLSDGFKQWAFAGGDDSEAEEIMAAGRFENMISKADKEYTIDFTPAEFVELLDPMFDFFNEHDSQTEDDSIPIEALIIFLDDKGIAPLAKALEKERNDGIANISKKQIIIFIQDFVESIAKEKEESEAAGKAEAISTEVDGMPDVEIIEEEIIEEEINIKKSQPDLIDESDHDDGGSFDDDFLISLAEIVGRLENSKQSDDFNSIDEYKSIDEYEQSVEMKGSDDEFILNVKSELDEFTKQVVEFKENIAEQLTEQIAEEVEIEADPVDEEINEEVEAGPVDEEINEETESEMISMVEQPVEETGAGLDPANEDDIRKHIDDIEEIIGISDGDVEEINAESDNEFHDEPEPEKEIPNEIINLYEKVFGLSGVAVKPDKENSKAEEILKAELAGNLIEEPPEDEK